MTSEIQQEISDILNGKPGALPRRVDYSLKPADQQFIPISKHTIQFIVVCVVISENDEVLLIQEAKPECKEAWYLPAGRMEPNESLIDAARREMKEESGFEFEPEYLVLIEFQQGFWYRFTFTGKIIGGRLKTLAEKDAESLQANWFTLSDFPSNVSLRSTDILLPIRKAKEFLNSVSSRSGIKVTLTPHKKMFGRVVISKMNDDFIHVIKSDNSGHLPILLVSVHHKFHQPFNGLIEQIFENCSDTAPKVHGILSVEHDASGENVNHDGYCMTLLISVEDTGNNTLPRLKNGYSWIEVTDEVVQNVLKVKLEQKLSICSMEIY